MTANTYCDRANIIKYVKHADRWRFAPVARRPSGNIHWYHVLIDGLPQLHPEGKYFIEWREGGVRNHLGMGLDEKVIAAVREYRFKPAMYEDHAVSVQIVIASTSLCIELAK